MFTEHSEMQERILKRNLGKRSRFGVHLYREQGRHLLAPLCVLMRAGTFCLGEQLPQWRYLLKCGVNLVHCGIPSLSPSEYLVYTCAEAGKCCPVGN